MHHGSLGAPQATLNNGPNALLRLYDQKYLFLGGGAAPEAYGGSLARGLIGATVASLRRSHSNARSKPRLRPTRQLMQRQFVNPQSEARDRTRILVVPSQIRFHCAVTGTPETS